VYGLINNSLKSMILEKFGSEQWQLVLSESGVPDDSFLSLRSYEDSVTFALVEAASKVLGAPVDACLEMFGEYWVLEVASKSYGPLMNAVGQNMVEFLGNLNALHDRITSTFLYYVPPEFNIEAKGDRHLIHYISQRECLSPFVVGLLRGLAMHFDCEMTILSQVSVEVERGAYTVFETVIVPS